MLPILLVILFASGDCSDSRKGRDSYLDAYKESHGGSAVFNKVKEDKTSIDRGHFPNGPSGFDNGGPFPYPAPVNNYGPPQPVYGPPRPPAYGPPLPPAYGPPQPPPVYGPPQPPPVYGPPQPQPPVSYGPPPVHVHNYAPEVSFPKGYGLLGLFEKFKLKLDILTILKILLKIALFKKFVAFVGILCLLLFIPWIKSHHVHTTNETDDNNHMDDIPEMDEERKMGYPNKRYAYLNNLTAYVSEAIERYSRMQDDDKGCQTVYCKTNKIVEKFTKRIPYRQLVRLYFQEASN